MKRILGLIGVAAILFSGSQSLVFSQEQGEANEVTLDQQASQAFGRALKIKEEMSQIAREVVESDQELINLRDKVQSLTQELRDKVREKLENHPAYSKLKEEAEVVLKQLQGAKKDIQEKE
jgi:hypothetical protein